MCLSLHYSDTIKSICYFYIDLKKKYKDKFTLID
jgi:hypothetical protein